MKKLVLSFLCLGMLLSSCNDSGKGQNQYDIVPFPNFLEAREGNFTFNNESKIIIPENADEATELVAKQFADQYRKTTGMTLTQEKSDNVKNQSNAITFKVNSQIVSEGYSLKVDRNNIALEASNASGFFYAMQSLKQLMPVEIYGNSITQGITWKLPCTTIHDAPRFEYRGMHMDVARHFFSIDEVKKYIDILAVHKLNKLHWHLTDDQGWRIDIKKYPELAKISSVRKKTMIGKEWENYDHTPYGGYYTQDEIREVVAYAAERLITIIPEVDMPGHMLSAMAAFPHLGCTGGPYEVSGQWGIRDDILCAGKEETFTFVENVLLEVMDLFPSEYIHIGGDEAPKVRWEKCPHCQRRIKELGIKSDEHHKAEHYLQSYFISRVEKFLNDHGRQIIGWDEILEGGLAPNATVMSWRGTEGGIEAAKQSHKVIMTPNSYLYFDYYQSQDVENEPFGIGGYVPIEKVYGFEPIPAALDKDKRKYIWGVQANLWAEYIKTDEHLEYMLLPRLAALSELQWTQPEIKNWDRFLASLNHITKIYDIMGYNYAKHIYDIVASHKVNPENNSVQVTLDTQGDAPIYYTLDGTEPTEKSTLYKKPIEITQTSTLKAMVKRDNIKARILSKEFKFNKATGKLAKLNTAPSSQYTGDGATILTDGVRGNFNFGAGAWLGYLSEPLDITLDFPEETEISSVTIGTLITTGDWIFPPTQISIYAAGSDSNFTQLYEKDFPVATSTTKSELKDYECKFNTIKTNKIRVVANTTNPIPEWHGGKGSKGFLFVDEIIVE